MLGYKQFAHTINMTLICYLGSKMHPHLQRSKPALQSPQPTFAAPPPDANLQISFDVGHSSIGWAVLEKTGAQTSDINILGCGSVVFRADDCRGSKVLLDVRFPALDAEEIKFAAIGPGGGDQLVDLGMIRGGEV
jgi:hypothetical protein